MCKLVGKALCLLLGIAIPTFPCTGFILHKRTFQSTALGQVKIQLADGVPNHISFQGLFQGGKVTVCAIRASLAPTSFILISSATEQKFAVMSAVL